VTDAERVEVDAALERLGHAWLPAKGDRIVLRPTGSVVSWSGRASGDVAVIGGCVVVGLERVWGSAAPDDVTMHDLACIFPEAT
jgi:hypothetical protein